MILKKLHLFTALLTIPFASGAFAGDPQNLEQTLNEYKTMSTSIQKINALYTNCKMESQCIIDGLRLMVEKDKDPIAKSMLADFEKQQKVNMGLMEKCFDKEKMAVSNALAVCEGKDPCIESHLLDLIMQGNSLAEMTLLNHYHDQNNLKKMNELKQKLDSEHAQGKLNSLRQCLDSKIK